MTLSMEIRIYSWQNEDDVCEYSIQWKAYFTSKKEEIEIMAHSLNKVWIHAVWTTFYANVIKKKRQQWGK